MKDLKRSLSEGSKTGVLLKDPKSTKKIFNQETFTHLQIFFLNQLRTNLFLPEKIEFSKNKNSQENQNQQLGT